MAFLPPVAALITVDLKDPKKYSESLTQLRVLAQATAAAKLVKIKVDTHGGSCFAYINAGYSATGKMSASLYIVAVQPPGASMPHYLDIHIAGQDAPSYLQSLFGTSPINFSQKNKGGKNSSIFEQSLEESYQNLGFGSMPKFDYSALEGMVSLISKLTDKQSIWKPGDSFAQAIVLMALCVSEAMRFADVEDAFKGLILNEGKFTVPGSQINSLIKQWSAMGFQLPTPASTSLLAR